MSDTNTTRPGAIDATDASAPAPALKASGDAQVTPPGLIHSAADWRGPQLLAHPEWLYQLDANEVSEIELALAHARSRGATLDTLTREDFPLERFPRRVDQMRTQLDQGCGLFVARGFPAQQHDVASLRMIYWGLGLYMGSAVSQSGEGDVLGDVRDLKVDLSGPRGRGYKTKAELEYHTDSCDVVALLVLRTAKSGGLSMIASSVAIHNEIARRRPDLLAVLYQPFHWSLQSQQREGEAPTYIQPVFTFHQGHFACRYIRTHIKSAQRYPDVPRLTEAQIEALDLLDQLANDPAFHFSMMFEAGDLQVLNNHVTLHARTGYEDYAEPDRRRHLLRMWLSMPTTRPLSPLLGRIYPEQRAGAVRGGFPSRTGARVFETSEA